MNQKQTFRSRLSIGKYILLFLILMASFGVIWLNMSSVEVIQVCLLLIVEGIVFYHFLMGDEFNLVMMNDELHVKKEFRTQKYTLDQTSFIYDNGKIIIDAENFEDEISLELIKDNFQDFDELLLYLSERNLIVEKLSAGRNPLKTSV